jgi:putative ABC transport system permease protein
MWREFRASFARFVSVTALLMLGVFVLIGLNVTGPNMRKTAQTDYTREHLADAKVSSTVALNAADRRSIRNLTGIKTTEFGHTQDVLIKNSKHAMRVQSNPQTLSQLTLTEGHKARNQQQIVLNDTLRGQYHIGDKITFTAGKAGASTGLTHKQFTVVGFATSTEFLKKDKLGSTGLGSGTLYAFAYVSKSAFSSSKPNVARLAFTQTKGAAYSTAYEHHATQLTKRLQKTLKQRNDVRVHGLRSQLQKQINDGTKAINSGKAAVQKGQTQITSAQKQLDSQLAQAKAAGNSAMVAQLAAKQKALSQQQATLDGQRNNIALAAAKLTAARTSKRQLADVSLTIQSRNDYNDGYNNYGEDAARIDALGKSFPAFFFLIAILVSFTTMRRMVEEKRIEMGTLRALGYSKGEVMREFLVYSILTAITGTALGSVLGLVALPRIIFRAYTANFNFVSLQLGLHPAYIAFGFGLALFSTVLASWLAAHASLKIIPAELMLPKPPASGSRILLERIGFVWRKMSFSHKVTARNLFRYKGRMLMTIIGVAGATALMITGFGIRDSLNTIVDRQFGGISHYDLIAVYNPDASTRAVDQAQNVVTQSATVKRYTSAYFANVYATSNGSDSRENIALTVPQHSAKLNKYVKLHAVQTNQPLSLSNNGAIISQKLAKLQGVQAGDSFTIHDADGNAHRIKVAGIATMYAGHYIYMNQTYYAKVYGAKAQANAYYVTLKNNQARQVNAFAARFNHHAAAVSTVQAR